MCAICMHWWPIFVLVGGVEMDTTATGIPVIDCSVCGSRHPETRAHCVGCGKASLSGHDFCEVP